MRHELRWSNPILRAFSTSRYSPLGVWRAAPAASARLRYGQNRHTIGYRPTGRILCSAYEIRQIAVYRTGAVALLPPSLRSEGVSCRTKVHSPSQKSEIFASPLKEGAKFGAPIQQPAKLKFIEHITFAIVTFSTHIRKKPGFPKIGKPGGFHFYCCRKVSVPVSSSIASTMAKDSSR